MPHGTRRSYAAALALILIGTLFPLTGCGRAGSRAELVICNGAEPESLDPARVTSQPDLRLAGALFEGLTRLNSVTATAEPGLAERWEILEDGVTYRFHLRTNAFWSTGELIRAEDVVYSWRRVVDPSGLAPYAGQLYPVLNAEAIQRGRLSDVSQLGIRAIGTHELEVRLERPTAYFLELCAFPTLAVVSRRAIESKGDAWTRSQPVPVSGAYALEFWRIHDRIRLRRNPYYWDATNVSCRSVDFLPIDKPAAALNLYETGQTDIIWDKTLIPSELVDVLLKRRDCRSFDYLATYFLRFNTTRPPFDDARVRRAWAMAVDKERLVTRITRAGERPASHFTPSGIARYQPPEGLGFDPNEAARLLAEAGYPGGEGFPVVTYLFNSGRLHQQLAVELQQMWSRHLGVRFELRQTETQVFLGAQRSLEYDICRSSWVGDYNDPNSFLELFLGDGGNNRTGWRNAEYDRLLEEANRQADLSRRAELLKRAEVILVREELPILPLFFYKGIHLFDPDKWEGIHDNILDQHPVRSIRRKREVNGVGRSGKHVLPETHASADLRGEVAGR